MPPALPLGLRHGGLARAAHGAAGRAPRHHGNCSSERRQRRAVSVRVGLQPPAYTASEEGLRQPERALLSPWAWRPGRPRRWSPTRCPRSLRRDSRRSSCARPARTPWCLSVRVGRRVAGRRLSEGPVPQPRAGCPGEARLGFGSAVEPARSAPARGKPRLTAPVLPRRLPVHRQRPGLRNHLLQARPHSALPADDAGACHSPGLHLRRPAGGHGGHGSQIATVTGQEPSCGHGRLPAAPAGRVGESWLRMELSERLL